MARHYVEASHGSVASLKFIGIEKITIPLRGGDIIKKLLQREAFWIYTLNAASAGGVNDQPNLSCFL